MHLRIVNPQRQHSLSVSVVTIFSPCRVTARGTPSDSAPQIPVRRPVNLLALENRQLATSRPECESRAAREAQSALVQSSMPPAKLVHPTARTVSSRLCQDDRPERSGRGLARGSQTAVHSGTQMIGKKESNLGDVVQRSARTRPLSNQCDARTQS